MSETVTDPQPLKKTRLKAWLFDVLLLVVLLGAAYFRYVGINWGEYQYLHPDERFLVWVGSDISPLKCLDPTLTIDVCPEDQKTWMGIREYFDAANSTLNPINRGHGFFVYGTLPMFVTRYAVQWIFGHSGFNEMTDVGRPLSALVDLVTVLLVFAIASRQYDRRVGILAAAFVAMMVLMIQQSHFFTMDTFVSMFIYLAIYFAVRVSKVSWLDPAGQGSREFPAPEAGMENPPKRTSAGQVMSEFVRRPLFWMSIAFGAALGCAVASKLNSAPVAFMLPAAMALSFVPLKSAERKRFWLQAFSYLVLGAVVSLVVFRLFQPYTFSGPGLLGIKPNPQWVANIREQRIQANGDVDYPPSMQWARRPLWFSGQNLVLWGLGLPLGMLAWWGFLWTGLRMLKGDWQRHVLLWGWVSFYFFWQSLAFNPTMRYQLPVYPALGIFAAWVLVALFDLGKLREARAQAGGKWLKAAAFIIGGLVLAGTFAWAFAFTRIYARPITRVAAARWIYQNVPGPINLRIQGEKGLVNQPVAYPYGSVLAQGQPYATTFTARETGEIQEIYLAHALDVSGSSADKTLSVSVGRAEEGGSQGSVTSAFGVLKDPRGEGYMVVLDQPVPVVKDMSYLMTLQNASGDGQLVLSGAATANESSWDDGLPLRIDNYDGYGGIYQPGLNFEMYWDDNPDKLQRLSTTLDQSDYIFITSNRQWGSLPRLPERFPLTIEYYRSLLGCPPEKQIEWCYAVAQPGSFKGDLGFELVKVFQSDPSIGSLRINDQFAEEAFTVYDHPKVLVFRKNEDYDPQKVRSILGSVDLSRVVHVTPKRAGDHPNTLTLSEERWAEQQSGGTWSELYNTQALTNRYPLLGAVLWYISLLLLGLIAYPFLRLALPGLADGGYPMARTTGLLLLSYLVWMGGSFNLPFSWLTISLALLLMLLASAALAYRQRGELGQAWRDGWRYFLLIEALFLALFLFLLMIRMGNPDLWHPWKGGEKPMDFAYFNAVLKSTTFPPYDPWFAGGYLNYYYYGFLLVGVLVKWLGIVPAVAYNLILPSLFAMIALGAFSIGWNLMAPHTSDARGKKLQYWIGLAAALGMALLGNLGTVRMIYQGYQRLAAPGGVIEGAGLLTRLVWAVRGAVQAFTGTPLPFSLGDWYWLPSRAIPAPEDIEPITEFPFFTALYADPHAHLYALPITLLVIGFALSVVLGRGRWKGRLGIVCGFLLGGLSIGALRPTNTWDIYTYLPLGCVAVAYTFLVYYKPAEGGFSFWRNLPENSRRALVALAAVLGLFIVSLLLYQPFASWYAQAYSKVTLWKGTHTSLSAYLTHWGLFLFLVVSWMVWETRDWLATTPLSAVRKLQPYRTWIYTALAMMMLLVAALIFLGVWIAWFVLPLAAWAGVLLLRPGIPDTKRFILFLVGTALILTLMVEVIVLVGDIGRMNTVFKFYLQAWTLLSISAAAALGWLVMAFPAWSPRWRLAWQLVLTALVAGAALFTAMGSMAKVKDRMAPQAPHTLDGMAYMQYAGYVETWGTMDLSQDYRAIRWMQENVKGSPVIVEANLRDLYRWGSRFSVYTGLPGVVGWEWHEQQQRAVLPGTWISDRIIEVDNFYTSTDLGAARDFLRRYNVKYIILGQQERGKYPGPGLDKFPAADGSLWKSVYRDGDTEIYEVLDLGGEGS